MNGNEVMKCPKCGAELERGRMQAAGIVFWNKDDIEEHFTSHWRGLAGLGERGTRGLGIGGAGWGT